MYLQTKGSEMLCVEMTWAINRLMRHYGQNSLFESSSHVLLPWKRVSPKLLYYLLARTSESLKIIEQVLIGSDPISDGFVYAQQPLKFAFVCARKQHVREVTVTEILLSVRWIPCTSSRFEIARLFASKQLLYFMDRTDRKARPGSDSRLEGSLWYKRLR